MSLCLESTCGATLRFPVERWHAAPAPEDVEVLDRLSGPVLDVGCGPGRHVLALAERGVVALGIDASPTAVALARRRGASALERSVFDRVPGTGRWAAALLLDGNIGIGGDPVALLARVAELLRRHGTIAVEVEPPDAPTEHLTVRLDDGVQRSAWFPWARVGVDGIATLAAAAEVGVDEVWDGGGRWFALLRT